MSFTFDDQQNLLSRLLGDSDADSESMFPLADRKKEINQGELAFARDSKCVVEYATGTLTGQELSLPSDWMETLALVIDNKVIGPDREISPQDYYRFYSYGGDDPYYYIWEFSGTKKYKFFGGTLTGKTYMIWYFQKPSTELSDAADVSLLPEEFRRGPVYWAAAALLNQIGKTELADRFLTLYMNEVNRAKAYAEAFIAKKNYPIVDVDYTTPQTTDVEGGGWPQGVV